MKSFGFFDKLEQKSKEQLLDVATFMKIPAGIQLYSQGDICGDILLKIKSFNIMFLINT